MELPLRVAVSDCYLSSEGHIVGNVVTGKVEGGVLQKDQQVLIVPPNVRATVKSITIHSQLQQTAVAGDWAEVALHLPHDFELANIQ